MFYIYSVVPHFLSKEQGPCEPRMVGYDSSEKIAKERAKLDQGFYRSINEQFKV